MKIEIDKPVVPQWFDDWYKTFNDGGNKARALYYLNRTGWGNALIDGNEREVVGYYDKLEDLLGDYGYENAKEYLSKAIIVGYEVEKEPLYYAKIKGWELTKGESVFWNYRLVIADPVPPRLYTSGKEDGFFVKNKMTIEEWNEAGINNTNADFEEVE